MRKLTVFLCGMVLVFGVVGTSNAILWDRGAGMIYDSGLDITWYDFTYGKTSWQNAYNWADSLSIDISGIIIDDWRLPTTVDGFPIYGYAGPNSDGTYSYTFGYNLANSEMGHLYYTELGNEGHRATDGSWPQPPSQTNPGLFNNLPTDDTWSGSEHAHDPGQAWYFNFNGGSQYPSNKNDNHYAIAVRDGDVVAHPILLGWDYPNGLITVNPVTAGYTIILDSNRQFEAMAYDPENKLLYAIENLGGDNLLVSIDYKNELITDIGYVEGYTEITSMAFDRTMNTLYAIDQTTRTLLEINLQTGAGTTITNYSSGTSNALAAHPITGELYLGWDVDPSYLTKIDKTTGALTIIGSLGINAVTAFDFNPESLVLYGAGQFYGSGYQLFTVDIKDGTINPIGPLGQVTSLAFIDNPLTIDITVTTPNGGEVLAAGDTYAITWTSEGEIENVKIEYSVDDGIGWTEIVLSTVNNGSYDWNVPCNISTDSLIRISGLDSDASDTSDDVFSIIDVIAPDIDVSVTPEILWPPNHKMVHVTTTVTATDNCDIGPTIQLVSIVMDESDEIITYDPNYDFSINEGKTLGDIEIVDDYNFYLRSERSGKSDGRTYTITYKAIDESGNESTAYAEVLVPHSM
jgi:hypothetical protein